MRYACVALVACLLAACSGLQTTSTPESVTYQTPYERVIEASAEAAADAGLTIESAEESGSGNYVILASKYERLSGQREPIRIADVEIVVKSMSGGSVVVEIEQQKLTRTSTIGTSSGEQIDYPRRIYRRLERRLKS